MEISPIVTEFLAFVQRLPLSEEQKRVFVRNHIETIKQHQKEKKENKQYYSNAVLVELVRV
jgi:hypothetical protein